jgi:hypothetical protein
MEARMKRLVLRDLIATFRSYNEGNEADNQSWWEGYAAAMEDAGVIQNRTYNAFIRYITNHIKKD